MKLKRAAFIFPLLFCISAIAGEREGGGGNIVVPGPLQPADISAYLREDARVDLHALVRFLEMQHVQSREPILEKFFKDDQKIYEILNELQLDIREDGPCYDRHEVEQDGSATKPNIVCLSPFLLAPRLNSNTLRNQTLSLLLHEVSHLVNFSEAEAYELQVRMLWRLEASGVCCWTSNSPKEWMMASKQKIRNMGIEAIRLGQELIKEGASEDRYSRFALLEALLSEFTLELDLVSSSSPYALLRPEMDALLKYYEAQLHTSSFFVFDDNENEAAEELFRDKPRITWHQWYHGYFLYTSRYREGGYYQGKSANLMIERINSPKELGVSLVALGRFLNRLAAETSPMWSRSILRSRQNLKAIGRQASL
jgi:hypothetical protein